MPIIPGGKTPIIKFQPIKSCVYNPVSRGFDIMCRKGHCSLMSFLDCFGQPVVARQEAWQYFVPELFWEDLFHIMDKCGYKFPELLDFYTKKKAPPWDEPSGVEKDTLGGTVLRSYQVPAVEALLEGNLILGDDLGLGKTISTIQAFTHILANNRYKDKAPSMVVVVPNDDVAGDWVTCIEQHFANALSYRLIKSRADMKRLESVKIILIPYSKIWREGYIEPLLEIIDYCILVPDEAHRISRVSSKQHEGCYKLGLKALAVWCLSGTEVSNTPDQYFGMYRMVRQPVFGEGYTKEPKGVDEKLWISYFRDTATQNQWNTKRLGALKTLRQGFALRRTKEEVQGDLPPLTLMRLPCTMDDVTRKIYRDLEVECEAELMRQGNPEVLKEDHFWTIYLRLIQLCSHPMLLGEERIPVPNKWERVSDIIEECSGSQKIGIWSNFPRTIDWLAKMVSYSYPWLRVEVAHGGVSKDDRAVIKEAVKAGEVDVLIANPMIWGEGVNLQAISCGIYWDYSPRLVQWKQSQGRFHRQGQTKPVTLYLPCYRNSVDVKILDWLEQKATLARMITGN